MFSGPSRAILNEPMTGREISQASRPSFPTRVLEHRGDVRTFQKLPGSNDVTTTSSYARVLSSGPAGVPRLAG